MFNNVVQINARSVVCQWVFQVTNDTFIAVSQICMEPCECLNAIFLQRDLLKGVALYGLKEMRQER